MRFLLAILTAFALLPAAGWSKDVGRSDPADPGSAVMPFKYESTFHRYLPHQDSDTVSDWRETGFDRKAPRAGAMGDMRVQPAPAQPRKDGAGSSGNGMRRMHKM